MYHHNKSLNLVGLVILGHALVQGRWYGKGNIVVVFSLKNRIGQAQFNILRQKGLDSICWRHAAMSIDADCETMAHSRKQRLAIQLSNCHLQVQHNSTDFAPMRCCMQISWKLVNEAASEASQLVVGRSLCSRSGYFLVQKQSAYGVVRREQKSPKTAPALCLMSAGLRSEGHQVRPEG